MRPSIARFSDMPGPRLTFSPWWGDKHGPVVRQKGVVQYTLSPWQAQAAPKMFRSYIANGSRRLLGEALYILIPFGTGYAIYSWGKSYDAWQNSKAGHIALAAHGDHE